MEAGSHVSTAQRSHATQVAAGRLRGARMGLRVQVVACHVGCEPTVMALRLVPSALDRQISTTPARVWAKISLFPFGE